MIDSYVESQNKEVKVRQEIQNTGPPHVKALVIMMYLKKDEMALKQRTGEREKD